jgi:tetratricopeptide (TPR) repeat protein
MKVFLSHSTKDKDFVQQLAAAIVGGGSETWLCEVDVGTYENFVAEVERGLKWCDVAVLVWSPDAAASKWTEAEWTSVLARQVAEQKTRLGIVLLRNHPLPELLRTTNYIDARTDTREAFRRVVAWLEHRESVKRFLGLPEYRPQDFVGRAVYLQQLRTTFSGEPTVFLLNGEPGAGKSTLALQFAWDAQKDFDAVVYQTCGQRSIDTITAELVERLPIDVKTLPPDKQRDAAKDWLRQRESLLILDDVWPNNGKIEIREFEPGPSCSVLYTSRQKSISGVVPRQTSKVEKFTDAEAEELFHTYLDESFSQQEVDNNRQPLLDFASRVEMLPIAVSVGASLLREMSATSLTRAVSKLNVGSLSDGVKNVNNLFAQTIASQTERDQQLLAACAVCVPEGFWLPLAAQIAELSEDDADEAANVLVRGSLLRVLDRDRRRFQLHALLREQLRSRAGRQGLANLQERHAQALKVLFKDWETRWEACRECLAEVTLAAAYLHGRRKDENAPELDFDDLGWMLAVKGFAVGERIGEWESALQIMRQQESLWIKKNHPRGKQFLQASYGNQALILESWGQLGEALALHKHAEAIAAELGDKSSLQAIYGNQALIVRAWGRFDEAMELLKKQEVICLESGNKDGLQRSYGNQALILSDWGRLDEAMALHRKEENIALELGNKDSLQRSYGNQALILDAWENLDGAMELLKKKEVICLELGNKDGLQQTYGNQALILESQGQLEEALKLHKQQESISLDLGSKDGLQRSYGNQANILIRQGKFTEAEGLLQKKEALCSELSNKRSLGYCYGQWADLEAARGDHVAQKQKLQEAVAVFTELNMPRERGTVQAKLDRLNSSN